MLQDFKIKLSIFFMTIFCFRLYGCLPSCCLICSRSLNTRSLFNFGDCVFRLFFRNSCHFSQTKFPSHFLCACFHCIVSNAKLHFISVLTLAISMGIAIGSWTFIPLIILFIRLSSWILVTFIYWTFLLQQKFLSVLVFYEIYGLIEI